MIIALASCRSTGAAPAPAIVQPGAPGESTRTIAAGQAADVSKVQHSPADVRFMQQMIHHHAQALEMVNLLETRTRSEEIRTLALRIELSQDDEITMMRRWLEVRGEEAPVAHTNHVPDAPLMPGMLTPQEMDRLASAESVAFDRLFLEFMIKHHAGAITMIDDLFSEPGAAQESEIFAFVSDVVADQRAEIERMGAMLIVLKENPR